MEGVIKCNVDASFSKDAMIVGGGVVFRDSYGDIVWVVVFKPFPSSSTLVAKTFCFQKAICWAQEFNFLAMLFELDAKIVLDVLSGLYAFPIKIASLTYDISLMLNSFPRYSVSYIRWDENRVAHFLAFMSNGALGADWILSYYPPELLRLMELDRIAAGC
ncbi:uncharacterized protein LOC132301759 [Cornus florida]|uniref:uncharacterized protein LOC132301759 n=1 Tax=Cornus florida TaxID=4283 RepID=UPI0028985736|nr:uncharacterized protein LOC132301759 [Cornus florida]